MVNFNFMTIYLNISMVASLYMVAAMIFRGESVFEFTKTFENAIEFMRSINININMYFH